MRMKMICETRTLKDTVTEFLAFKKARRCESVLGCCGGDRNPGRCCILEGRPMEQCGLVCEHL